MYSFQRRSQSIQNLKKSQSINSITNSQCSRNGSSKKFIQVCSKKGYEPTPRSSAKNLRDSNVSLPINFQERQQIPHYNLAHSQANPPTRQSLLIRNQNIPNIIREQSLPTKTIIIRETIIQTPLSFNYQPPRQIHTRIQPVSSNYRQSLPLKLMQNKNDIVRQNPIRQAAMPIRIFSQNSPIINSNQPLRRMPVFVQKRPQQNNPIISHQIINPTISILPNYQIRPDQIFSKQQFIDHKKQSQMLSNKFYVECEVKIIPKQQKINENQLKNSKILLKSSQIQQRKTDYNSLTVTKQDQQNSLKQNLDIRKNQHTCQKIKNFSDNANIKINVKQALMPKKNIILM